MLKKDLIIIPVQLILLFVYVNTVFLFDYYVYDALPRILNALTTYFVFPVVFAGIIYFIGIQLIGNIEFGKTLSTLELPFFYSAIIWLPILIFTQIGIKDYFKLKYHKALEATTLPALYQEVPSDLSFVSIEGVQPNQKQAGFDSYTHTRKSGDSYTTTQHFYKAIPVVKQEEQQTTNCWLCLNDTQMTEFNTTSQSTSNYLVKGMVIHDPYVRKHCKTAIRNADMHYETDVPLFLVRPIEDYTVFYERKERWTIWFFRIVNFLFVGIPFCLMIISTRDYSVR